MLLAQPKAEVAEAPYSAVVARQLSVWPFATRTLRLFVLIDPSLPDPTPRRGLVRAMQQAYFGSDGCSQTRAVRDAALAAHYVLQHHNRDVLPLHHVNAATAVAALRGDIAFVALAGDAAAFAWRNGVLTSHRGVLRLPRPLGLEQDPNITLWSTRLEPGDRLLLVCGAAWRPDSARLIEDILQQSADADAHAVEGRLAEALRGSRPAGVLVADQAPGARRRGRHLALVSSRQLPLAAPRPAALPPARVEQVSVAETQVPVRRRWATRLLALALGTAAALAALIPMPAPTPRLAGVHQVQALLAQADATIDPAQAHALAADALDLARHQPPADHAEGLVSQAARTLDRIDRVVRVAPAMAVRLGQSSDNIVDLAVGDDTLYTLDVVEATVRAFPLDGLDLQPTPDTLLVRAGAPVGSGARPMATPVAIQYLSGSRPELGVLAIVDQARGVVQVGHDRALSPRPVPSSASWRELGALGADTDGRLFVLDSGARRLLEYPSVAQRTLDPPRLLLDDASAPGLAFDKAAEIVGQQDDVYVRMDDGTLRHFDAQGRERAFAVTTPDAGPPTVSAVAPDRAGGLYLADAAHARILHTTADGTLVRQLLDPVLAGVRQIRSSLDGRRLYGLVATGVLVIDLPPDGAP